MRRLGIFAIAIAVLCLPQAEHGDAHTFHASLTQIDYNEQTGKAEIAIRLFANDLEDALERRLEEKDVRITATPSNDQAILAYLSEALRLVPGGESDPSKLEWVGKEVNVDVVWVYVQADLPHGLQGLSLSNTVFFELFTDQVNLVNVHEGSKRASYSFKPDSKAIEIDLHPNSESPSH